MKKEFVINRLATEFCHASSIISLPGGDRLCAWFGGSREGNADVAIWVSRYCGGWWQTPRKVADGAQANWNPVLYCDGDRVLLFYKEGQSIAAWKTLLRISADGGNTWSEERELVRGDASGGRGPVRNKAIRLADGTLLAGGSLEKGLWTAFADLSRDGGKTWSKSAPISIDGLFYNDGEKTAVSSIPVSEQSFYGRGVIQPSLWESVPGKAHMLLRSSEGRIYRSDSADGGVSWSAAYSTGLPNNNSGLDVVRASFDGCLYLVCNPVGENWGIRSPLSLFKSEDNGASWRLLCDLESGMGEFSYPAVIEAEDGILLTYTWNRLNIVCCKMGWEELK